MTSPENASNSAQTPLPEGFIFNPDILSDVDEQVEFFLRRQAYQEAPIPSFENVPTTDVPVSFNPTNAPESEIYATNRAPAAWAHLYDKGFTDPHKQLQMWRIVDRSRLIDGTGLVSSNILLHGSLGEVEKFDPTTHWASQHDGRLNEENGHTPFVSFSTDPVYLANSFILHHGFGIANNRDAVVVRVAVDSNRVLTSGAEKEQELLLLGGVAPDEYLGAYEVSDFVNNLVGPDTQISVSSTQTLSRDEAISYWRSREV